MVSLCLLQALLFLVALASNANPLPLSSGYLWPLAEGQLLISLSWSGELPGVQLHHPAGVLGPYKACLAKLFSGTVGTADDWLRGAVALTPGQLLSSSVILTGKNEGTLGKLRQEGLPGPGPGHCAHTLSGQANSVPLWAASCLLQALSGKCLDSSSQLPQRPSPCHPECGHKCPSHCQALFKQLHMH